MIKGTNQKVNNGEGGYTPYVGLGTAKLVAINPSNEEFMSITGRENPYPLTYEPMKNEDGSLNYQHRFLTYNEEAGYNFVSFNVGVNSSTSQAGNLQFLNHKGESAWGKDLDSIKANSNMAWFDTSKARVAKDGEVNLINFLSKWLAYSSRAEGAQLMIDLKSMGIGDYTNIASTTKGLKTLIKEYSDNYVTLFYVVKPSADGSKFYQDISTKNDMYFFANPDGTVPKNVLGYYVDKIVKNTAERGATLCKEGVQYELCLLTKFGGKAVEPVKLESKVDTEDGW